MKTCRGCNETKPLEDFCRSQRERDGRATRCRSCRAEQRREYKARNPEKVRESQKRNRRRHPDVAYAQKLRHKERNPEKYKARQAVWNAVYKGRIVKPSACEDCGTKVDQPRELQAHHHDYSKPLDVEWLCVSCHLAQHHVSTKGEEGR